MGEKHSELILSGLLFTCSVIIYFVIIPCEVGHGGFHGLSPAFFPKIVTSVIGVLSGAIFLKTSFRENAGKLPLAKKELLTVSIFVAGVAIYIYGIQYIGYYISTMFALIGSMLYLGVRRWRTMIFLTLIMEVSLYLLFEKGLRITMSRGFLF